MVVIYDEEGNCILCLLSQCIRNLKNFAEKRGDKKLAEKLEKMSKAYSEVLNYIEENYFGSYTVNGEPATWVTALLELCEKNEA